MKDTKLSIVINRPIEEVFNFTLDPRNTSKWISEIEIEETNEWPAKVGTIYRNQSKSGVWSQYKLIELTKNDTFVLKSNTDENFSVRYSFKPIGDTSTEFEYYEWTSKGDLSDPFTLIALEKLKFILENQA